MSRQTTSVPDANLTVLSGPENDRAGSRPFAQKRGLYLESASMMNRQIGACEHWTVETIEERAQRLVEMSMRVFTI